MASRRVRPEELPGDFRARDLEAEWRALRRLRMAVEPGTPAEREGERIREAAGRIYLRHGGATETALAELWAGLRDIGGERLVRSGERLLDRERRARERWARR